MKAIDFWFDPVSPFAYLAFERLPELLVGTVVHRRLPADRLRRPAQALDHKGPAEIEPKRAWTFRYVHWLAHREGVAIDDARSGIRSTRWRCRDSPGRARPRADAGPLRLRSRPAPCLARGGADAEDDESRFAALARAARSRVSIRPAREVKQALRDGHRRGARTRRLRRADDRHRRQALLGLRRRSRWPRPACAASPGSTRRTGSARARRAPASRGADGRAPAKKKAPLSRAGLFWREARLRRALAFRSG